MFLSFQQRLLMTVADAFSVVLIEYTLNKWQRTVQENSQLDDSRRHRLLQTITFLKSLFPFLVHFHHAIFYWNGAYYDVIKRIIGIKYVSGEFDMVKTKYCSKIEQL